MPTVLGLSGSRITKADEVAVLFWHIVYWKRQTGKWIGLSIGTKHQNVELYKDVCGIW